MYYNYYTVERGDNMMSFRMQKEEENFIREYAGKNSLNLSKFIRNAIFEKIENMEDIKIAEIISKDVSNGKEVTVSWEQFKTEMEN